MGTRYLMTSLTLVGTDAEFQEQGRGEQRPVAGPGHRHTLHQNHLRPGKARRAQRHPRRIVDLFNNALGGPVIKEIYITELAIQ